MPAYHEELFGPAAAILRAKDEDDAVRIANDTDFGLGASVWTTDKARGEAVARRLQAGATFVTLTKNDELRGCIGSLEAARPLGEDVAQNALGAAFRDPRFTPMVAHEWPQCRVEVSLLSTPKPLRFADEADLLAQIRAGEDGLVLEADGRRGTFLPQVWQDIQDKRAFLAHLLRKAGLPADTRLTRCKISRYRVVKWKE